MAQETQDSSGADPPLRFRNYVPRDRSLRQFCIPRPTVEELEKQIDREAEDAIQKAGKGDILSQIAPRRPNWDLKRDVEKKLGALSHRTDKAILQLIRNKLQDSNVAQELREKPGATADVECAAETLSKSQREIAQSVVNAMEDLERVENDADDT